MIRLFLTAVVAFAIPAVAFAAGDAPHEPKWSLTLWGFVNFALYCYILKRFAWPLIAEYLQDRHDSVVAALEAAARARKEAERLKSQFEMRMKTLESEAERARAEILGLAEVDAKRLVEQAEKTGEHIRKDAQLVADQEVARARRELQAESAELVTQIATGLVAAQVKPEDQERFVQDFLSESREDPR